MTHTPPPPGLPRRDFLRWSLAGTLLAGTAGSLSLLAGCSRQPATAAGYLALRGQDVPVVKALLRSIHAGVLAGAPAAREEQLERVTHSLDRMLADTAPEVRKAFTPVFDMLGLTVIRGPLFGLWKALPEATPAEVDAMLERMRTSSIDLPRAVYGGLMQLSAFAWYLDDDNRADARYPGPPRKVAG